jgi:hypothetical protein
MLCQHSIFLYAYIDSLLIILKLLALNLDIDISALNLKLVLIYPNFVVWVVLDWWMEIQ